MVDLLSSTSINLPLSLHQQMKVELLSSPSNELGSFWKKQQVFEIHNDLETLKLSDLQGQERVLRRKEDFALLLSHLRSAHPSTPLPAFPLSKPELLCAYFSFLLRHPVIGRDAQLIAFLTAAEYATVRDAIKTDPFAVQLPQFDKLRLMLFSGQVPLDSRYRKVERMARDLEKLRVRLRKVESVVDELVLLQSETKEDLDSASQFVTALRGVEEAVVIEAVRMDGLEAGRSELQLAKLLIENVKNVVQKLNNFRKWCHLGRIQAAKANDKLEQVTNAQEKPSFDAIYAAKEELERKAEELSESVKMYEQFGDSIIFEFNLLRRMLQLGIQSRLSEIFK